MKHGAVLPTEDVDNVPSGSYRDLLGQLDDYVFSLPKPVTDGEIAARCNDFFDFCRKSGLRPGIETLSAALKISRQTLWRWGKGVGCSQERTEVIQNALQRIAATLEQAHLQGKINPVSAIFLSKCWLGYRETGPQQGAPCLPDSEHLSPEQVRLQLEGIPIDNDIID